MVVNKCNNVFIKGKNLSLCFKVSFTVFGFIVWILRHLFFQIDISDCISVFWPDQSSLYYIIAALIIFDSSYLSICVGINPSKSITSLNFSLNLNFIWEIKLSIKGKKIVILYYSIGSVVWILHRVVWRPDKRGIFISSPTRATISEAFLKYVSNLDIEFSLISSITPITSWICEKALDNSNLGLCNTNLNVYV